MKTMTFLTAAATILAMTAATAKIIPHLTDPAPELTLAMGDGDHGTMNHGTPDRAMMDHGDLTLLGGFAFATLPNQPVGGGFVSVRNAGTADDRLIAATSDLAQRVEIHTMEMDDGVMKMREVAAGLVIPAGETVEMKPGGYHLMFMQLNDGLVVGEMAPVTLTFEQAGDVTLMLLIEKRMGGRDTHSNHGTN